MSERALTLTRRAALNGFAYLDLGQCGLTDFDFISEGWLDKALSICSLLQTLILSNSWMRFDDAQQSQEFSNYVQSDNKGESNYYRIIPENLKYLIGLKTFICAGDRYRDFAITDISLLFEVKSLQVIDLSNNQIEDLTGIEQLTNLRRLDVRGNKISDITPLIPLLTKKNNPLRLTYTSGAPLKDYEINLQGNPIDEKVIKVIEQGTEKILEHFGFTHIKRSKMNNNTIRVFLASSQELKSHRLSFEIFMYRETLELREKNILLILERWEDFYDGMSRTRKQDDYNQMIAQCDIFIILYSTKVGKYSNEEFENAYEKFMAHGKPLIFTYFINTTVSIASLNADDFTSLNNFQEKLKKLGHFPTVIDSDAELQFHFKKQLNKLYGI